MLVAISKFAQSNNQDEPPHVARSQVEADGSIFGEEDVEVPNEDGYEDDTDTYADQSALPEEFLQEMIEYAKEGASLNDLAKKLLDGTEDPEDVEAVKNIIYAIFFFFQFYFEFCYSNSASIT
jgi:hypothetical protein